MCSGLECMIGIEDECYQLRNEIKDEYLNDFRDELKQLFPNNHDMYRVNVIFGNSKKGCIDDLDCCKGFKCVQSIDNQSIEGENNKNKCIETDDNQHFHSNIINRLNMQTMEQQSYDFYLKEQYIEDFANITVNGHDDQQQL